MSSGWGFPGQRTSKKLIARVRPGVELVLAILAPSSELMTLDLPTLDRPRKATSGNAGAGKWPASLADIIKRARTRIGQFAVSSEKLQAGRPRQPRHTQFSIGLIPVPGGVCWRCLFP